MINMKSFLLIAVFGCIALLSCALVIDEDRVEKTDIGQKRERRQVISAITASMIAAAISAGTSLAGTTVGALMQPGFNVAAAGSVENYSKWALIFQKCDAETGYINKPMVNVDAGKKEGFASHKAANSAKGTWVYCLYKVNGKRVHIMYSVPYSFDMHYNWLALAITSTNTDLNANNMYYKDYSFMARKEYYSNIVPTEICLLGFCIKGTMGNDHKPTINIKLFPLKFENTSPSVKKSVEGVDNADLSWDKFIKDEFVN